MSDDKVCELVKKKFWKQFYSLQFDNAKLQLIYSINWGALLVWSDVDVWGYQEKCVLVWWDFDVSLQKDTDAVTSQTRFYSSNLRCHVQHCLVSFWRPTNFKVLPDLCVLFFSNFHKVPATGTQKDHTLIPCRPRALYKS